MSDRPEVRTCCSPALSRIGLFGGTFDPVHWGHLRIAEAACRTFALARVEFLPARTPPHKSGRTVTDIQHRLAMLEKALADQPCFRISREEAVREGPSFLVDTLRSYRARLPTQVSIFFLMGMDSYREISTWHDYADLFSLAHFVVVSRPGHPRPGIADTVSPQVAALFTEGRGPPPFLEHQSGHRVYFLESLSLMMSSAHIREEIRQGHSPSQFVPQRVLAYIHEHHLYA